MDVAPASEAIDDAADRTGAYLGAKKVGPGEAGCRRRHGHADHIRGEVIGRRWQHDWLRRRRGIVRFRLFTRRFVLADGLALSGRQRLRRGGGPALTRGSPLHRVVPFISK